MAHPKLKFKTLISFSTFLFFLFMLVSVLSYGVYGEDEEAAYMLKLLNALTPTPSNWSSNTPICKWSRVSCGNHSRVEEIDLSSMSLTGELPSGLNSLSKLTGLYLYNNSLSGPLPSLANLTFLQYVYLHNNNFSSIPDGCFQGLTSLQTLTMSNNVNLAPWTFPTDLNHSSQLTSLNLISTNLMGSLPNISHFFPSLRNLYLSHNNLNSIPDGYFQGLTSLRYLSLSDNTNLAPWTFPIHLTQSSNLEYLNLSVTNLVGPLPDISHSFPNLSYVDLSNNKLTSIPDGCFQVLTGLRQLNLSYNTNLAPWTFPNLTQSLKLHYLDLVATNIMGPLPDIFNSFPNLETIRLSNNSLTGVLPMSFAGSKVGTLWLNDQEGNGLSGTIEVLSSMSYLSQVWLQGNSFEGPIPDLSRCIDLEELLLGHNRLTGVIPLDSLQLDKLEKVSLDNNFLQGPVPDLTGFYFEYLNLGNTTNSFCRHDVGPCDQRVTTLLKIAEAFGYPLLLARSWRGNNPCHNWRYIVCDGGKIRTMNLTSQNLTGTISPAFGNLTDLQNLYLGGNNLSGSIPESLTNLTQLKVVDVSNNKLSGNIPRFSPKVMFTAIGNAFLEHSQANSTIPSPDSSHRPSPTASVTSHSPSWIAGASAAGVGAIVIFVVVIYNRNRYLSLVQKMIFKETFADHNVEDFIKSYSFLVPKRYTYSEVKRMTNSFHDKLGQGGYGTVYKASLSDGQQVAVKVLSESKRNGEEFINEVASISRTSHVNIVSLLGFCYEINKRALIYEFMPNGSLDEFIHKKGFPNPFCNLDWTTLYQITIGIARGLEYLHRGCSTRILHLDIKPQNILLDEDFCPKIADFGLAKICKKKESVVSILGTRGTPGYIAPEVFSRTYGRVSHKSDVYSYGMLILEVVGGRKNYDSGGSHTSEKYFPDWIYNDLEQGNILIRCSAETEEENDMIMKIILVSLWCIQPNPSERPSMSKVVEMLEGPLLSVSYPPKPVLYSPERSLLQFSDTSCNSIHETSSIIVEENDSIK